MRSAIPSLYLLRRLPNVRPLLEATNEGRAALAWLDALTTIGPALNAMRSLEYDL